MTYEHKTQYYETDQMGIIHHSNYIRWFEEARIDFMSQCGFSYAQMERDGVISPVLSVSCEYKSMTRFGDTVSIETRIEKYNGLKLSLEYTARDKETGEIRCLGKSSHCFLDREGKILCLRKGWEFYHESFLKAIKEADEAK